MLSLPLTSRFTHFCAPGNRNQHGSTACMFMRLGIAGACDKGQVVISRDLLTPGLRLSHRQRRSETRCDGLPFGHVTGFLDTPGTATSRIAVTSNGWVTARRASPGAATVPTRRWATVRERPSVPRCPAALVRGRDHRRETFVGLLTIGGLHECPTFCQGSHAIRICPAGALACLGELGTYWCRIG
jgi:hypothetical protein